MCLFCNSNALCTSLFVSINSVRVMKHQASCRDFTVTDESRKDGGASVEPFLLTLNPRASERPEEHQQWTFSFESLIELEKWKAWIEQAAARGGGGGGGGGDNASPTVTPKLSVSTPLAMESCTSSPLVTVDDSQMISSSDDQTPTIGSAVRDTRVARRASITATLEHIREGYLTVSPGDSTSKQWSYRYCTLNTQTGLLSFFAEKNRYVRILGWTDHRWIDGCIEFTQIKSSAYLEMTHSFPSFLFAAKESQKESLEPKMEHSLR